MTYTYRQPPKISNNFGEITKHMNYVMHGILPLCIIILIILCYYTFYINDTENDEEFNKRIALIIVISILFLISFIVLLTYHISYTFNDYIGKKYIDIIKNINSLMCVVIYFIVAVCFLIIWIIHT